MAHRSSYRAPPPATPRRTARLSPLDEFVLMLAEIAVEQYVAEIGQDAATDAAHSSQAVNAEEPRNVPGSAAVPEPTPAERP